MEEVLNKDVFVGLFATLLLLVFVLNLLVLALVLWPLNPHSAPWPLHALLARCPLRQPPGPLRQPPWHRRQSPKHVLLVALSLSQLLTAGLHHSLTLHVQRSRDGALPPPLGCPALVTSELAAYLFPTATRLLLAGLVVTELQKMASLDDVKRMTTACVWGVVAVVYACAVVVPVFFFLYLAYATRPCYPGRSVLRYTSHAADGKVLSVVLYLVPVVLVLSSLVALVLTYHCRRFREKTVRINGPAASSPNASRPPAGPGEILTDGSPAFPPRGRDAGPADWRSPSPSSSLHSRKGSPPDRNCGIATADWDNWAIPSCPPFPYDTVLAAVLAVVLELVFCVRQFTYWRQVEWEVVSRRTWVQLWAADRFLSLLSLLLTTCCWLLPPHLPPASRRRGNARAAAREKQEVKGWVEAGDLEEDSRGWLKSLSCVTRRGVGCTAVW